MKTKYHLKRGYNSSLDRISPQSECHLFHTRKKASSHGGYHEVIIIFTLVYNTADKFKTKHFTNF